MSQMEVGIGPAARKRGGTDVEPVEPPNPEEAAAAALGPDGSKADAKGANGVDSEHEFDLDFTDSRGHVWRGHFKCHVLTIKERVAVGLTRSRLAGGLPPSAIDPDTFQLLEMQSWLAIALDDSPPWAKNLGGYRDVSVIGKIYQEVLAHEDRFWATDAGPAGQSPPA